MTAHTVKSHINKDAGIKYKLCISVFVLPCL